MDTQAYNLRMPRKLHAQIAQAAAADGVSLNAWILFRLHAAVAAIGPLPAANTARSTDSETADRRAPTPPGRRVAAAAGAD